MLKKKFNRQIMKLKKNVFSEKEYIINIFFYLYYI